MEIAFDCLAAGRLALSQGRIQIKGKEPRTVERQWSALVGGRLWVVVIPALTCFDVDRNPKPDFPLQVTLSFTTTTMSSSLAIRNIARSSRRALYSSTRLCSRSISSTPSRSALHQGPTLATSSVIRAQARPRSIGSSQSAFQSLKSSMRY